MTDNRIYVICDRGKNTYRSWSRSYIEALRTLGDYNRQRGSKGSFCLANGHIDEHGNVSVYYRVAKVIS